MVVFVFHHAPEVITVAAVLEGIAHDLKVHEVGSAQITLLVGRGTPEIGRFSAIDRNHGRGQSLAILLADKDAFVARRRKRRELLAIVVERMQSDAVFAAVEARDHLEEDLEVFGLVADTHRNTFALGSAQVTGKVAAHAVILLPLEL